MPRESRRDEKGQTRRITFLGFLVGIICIMIVLIFGWFAFGISINDDVRECQYHFHNKAALLAQAAELLSAKDGQISLSTIEMLWRSQADKPPDEYMRIVDCNCRVVLNTAHPETIGSYAGNESITMENKPTIRTMKDVVKADQSHALTCPIYTAKNEIAAFVPVPKKGWVLGVYRSRAAIMQHFKEQLQGLRNGFLLVCLVLMPFSLLLLYFAVHLVRGIGKKAEQGWMESENRFLAFMDHLAAGALIRDHESRFLYLNQYARDLLDADESWIGKMTYDVMQSRVQIEEIAAEDRSVLSDGYLVSEGEVSDRRGVTRQLEVHKFPIEQKDGSKLVGALLIDITERKRQVERSKRLASIVKASDDAIFSTTPDGNITSWNRAAEQISGYARGEVIGKHVSLLVSPDKIEDVREAGEKLRSGQPIDHFETMVRKKDGALLEISLTVSPIRDLEGNITGASCICRDISGQKRLESQLRQAQKMEAIGTLAGGIAHDFNNILSAIIGLSELALLKIPENSSVYQDIDQVVQASMRAGSLVHQILAFSRQEEHAFIPISVDPVVREALKLLRSSLPSSIMIRDNIQSGLGVIEGDATQIHQVLMNLCTNAEHAMRGTGGVLEVTLERVDIDEKTAAAHPDLHLGAHVRLEVKDTGKGMDPGTMNRIFDPYFTTKGVGEGTGLGLAVAQGIVKAHQGEITVESQKGKGSIFRVYFPVTEIGKEATRYQEKKSGGPLPTGDERILFVDDEKVLVDIGAEILGGLGYQVTVRTSSIEALELFKAKPKNFDLVITDMSMPNMNGEELSRELLNIRSDIPIVLCTGFSHVISEQKARELGIRAFAMKPLIRKDLAETVRKVLDGN